MHNNQELNRDMYEYSLDLFYLQCSCEFYFYVYCTSMRLQHLLFFFSIYTFLFILYKSLRMCYT